MKHPRVLTVMNMKGGVGKTTIAMHLSTILAHHTIDPNVNKILIIDYDPQFNLSQSLLTVDQFMESEEKRRNILSVLCDNPKDIDPFSIQKPTSSIPPEINEVTCRIYENIDSSKVLDIIPSTLDLMYIALGKSESGLSTIESRFKNFINNAKKEYDLIIIDCHPAGSLFTKTALLASDDVLVPVTPHNYAMRGIGLMVRFLSSPIFNSHKPKMHILFNNSPKKDILIEDQIRLHDRFGPMCLSATMKRYTAFTRLTNGSGYIWNQSQAYSGKAYFNIRTIAVELLTKLYQKDSI